mgnify:FL=1
MLLTGADAAHMCKSLRMKPGDTVTLCDTRGFDYHCVIQRLSSQEAALTIIDKHQCENEPSLSVILYQGLPKGEKWTGSSRKPWSLAFRRSFRCGWNGAFPVRMEKLPEKDGSLAKNRGGSCQAVRTGDSPPGLPSRGFSPSTDSAAQAEVFLFCYEAAERVFPGLSLRKLKPFPY